MPKKNTTNTAAWMLAKILRDVLHAEEFQTMADLTDALKYSCARLHIRWTHEDLNAAFRLVGSNYPLPPYVQHATATPRRARRERYEPEYEISRRDAIAILDRLGIGLDKIR